MVPVKTCFSLPEALVVSSCLADKGIFAALNGYHHGSSAWHCLYALNGIQISVLDADFDEARDLLDQPRSDADADWDRGDRGQANLSDIVLAVVALLLAGLPMPVWSRRAHRDRSGLK
jgi:hypothetical protein